MYYKIIHNNMVIDLLTEISWIKYLPNSRRFIVTDKANANGIMGSDHDTIYHLRERLYNFNKDVKTVDIIEISQDEYNTLQAQISIQKQESEALKSEIDILKQQLEEQQELLRQILGKL